MKQKIAIATTSLIRSKEERNKVLETVEWLGKLKIPVIVTDGGSPDDDKKIIKHTPNVIFFEADSLDNEIMNSHKVGAEIADYIFYLHTDKLDLAKKYAPSIIEAHNNSKKGMFIISRTDKAFETYPSFQKTQENFLNFFMGDYIGIQNDYYYGPKIYPSFLYNYLNKKKCDFGWGVEAYFYVIAKRLGLPFEFYPVEIKSPEDVGSERDVKLSRLRCAGWQIEGLLQGNAVPLMGKP